jgi:hypothetical protein
MLGCAEIEGLVDGIVDGTSEGTRVGAEFRAEGEVGADRADGDAGSDLADGLRTRRLIGLAEGDDEGRRDRFTNANDVSIETSSGSDGDEVG